MYRSMPMCGALTAAALFATPLIAEEPSTPAWDVKEGVTPLTGAASATAALASTNTLTNMIGAPEKAALILRCSDRVLAAYVAWPQVLSVSGTAFMSAQTQTMVLWRLDDAPITVNFWDRSDSGIAAGKFTTGGAAKLIGQLATAKKLVVRATGLTQQDAVFDLSGMVPVARKVEQTCGLIPDTKP